MIGSHLQNIITVSTLSRIVAFRMVISSKLRHCVERTKASSSDRPVYDRLTTSPDTIHLYRASKRLEILKLQTLRGTSIKLVNEALILRNAVETRAKNVLKKSEHRSTTNAPCLRSRVRTGGGKNMLKK